MTRVLHPGFCVVYLFIVCYMCFVVVYCMTGQKWPDKPTTTTTSTTTTSTTTTTSMLKEKPVEWILKQDYWPTVS